jgi:predicted CXXCH cytochrome family protein
MKQLSSLFALFLVVFGIPFAVLAADTPQNAGPEIIKMKMGDKTLNFQHRKHQQINNNECFHCHKPQEWKIKKWDKEVAHQVCIACHDLNDKGPVECKGCHAAQ